MSCDACDAGAWIGRRAAAGAAVFDAWCEGCQRPDTLGDPPAPSSTCPRCGGALTLGEPRFEELPGAARDLAAVLHAWCGDTGPLAALLPDRPRLSTDLAAHDPVPDGAVEALVGDRPEARWDRAARILIGAVASAPGLPAPDVIARARLEAGEPSPYRSDPTVGRLLWTLLVERALAAGPGGGGGDGQALRAAERELEFRTFWDRAMVVQGYALLGMRPQAGEVAAALATELLDGLAAEPFARAPAGAWLGSALAVAMTAVVEGRPGDALAAVRTLIERPDVSRYRVPCVSCGRGSLGVEWPGDPGRRG